MGIFALYRCAQHVRCLDVELLTAYQQVLLIILEALFRLITHALSICEMNSYQYLKYVLSCFIKHEICDKVFAFFQFFEKISVPVSLVNTISVFIVM